MLVATAAAALLTNSVSAQGGYYAPPAASNLTNSGTSLTLLYQNNLNASDDVNHISAILLDSMTLTAGAAACAAIGESLLTEAAIKNYTSDFYHELSYLEFSGQAGPNQHFFIQNGVVAVGRGANNFNFPALPYGNTRLPVLCTQSSNQDSPYSAVATASNEITIASGKNDFVGFRNLKSFRFAGER